MKDLSKELEEAKEAIMFTESMDMTADEMTSIIIAAGAKPGTMNFDICYNSYLVGLAKGLRAAEIMKRGVEQDEEE